MEKRYQSSLENNLKTLSRRDALKGLAGLVLGASALGQESYAQEKQYTYDEFKEILYSKMSYRSLEANKEKEFKKGFESATPEEQKIYVDAFTKKLTPEKKKAIDKFLKENPTTEGDVKQLEEIFPFKMDASDPYSPFNIIMYDSHEYVKKHGLDIPF